MFDHIPEQRDQWIQVGKLNDLGCAQTLNEADGLSSRTVQQYLERMAAPKLSVHVDEHA